MKLSTNCYELFKLGFTSNGIYEVYPDTDSNKPVSVYCEMKLGGWTPIMNKVDNSFFFNEPMKRYVAGFGNVSASTNYWLGLNNIYDLTNNEIMTLRIEMSNSKFDKYFIEYDLFILGPKIEKFKMTLGTNTFGTIRDSFSYHKNMKFSTYDEDNDDSDRNCAKIYKAGWWFRDCYTACLTLTLEAHPHSHWNMYDPKMGHDGYRHFSHIKMLIRPRLL